MSATDSLEEFDDIRPYRDEEVPERIASLVRDPDLIRIACRVRTPRLYRCAPLVARWVVGSFLRHRTKKIGSRDDLQSMLSWWVEQMATRTMSEFTYSGIQNVPRNEPCIYISNHRDILIDAALVNYTLFLNDLGFTQNAVGDNLFQASFGNELMRLNGSFTIVRSAKSARKLYTALMKTSRYIRETLEAGESIWIAQREGRSKDGVDRTDPAIVKMFLLAYRQESLGIKEWLNRVNLIPVSLAYEIDPCAPMKARELYVREQTGTYTKEFGEDFRSIAQGFKGFKGKVHLSFGKALKGSFSDASVFASYVDESIRTSLRQFDTFSEAHRQFHKKTGPRRLPPGQIRNEFDRQLESLKPEEQPFLLLQYANQLTEESATEVSN